MNILKYILSQALESKIIRIAAIIFIFLSSGFVKGQFVLNGDARAIFKDYYLITEDREFSTGYIWSESKLDLSKPFELNFLLALGDKEGGDGIAFVMHNDARGTTAFGNSGAGLGFGFGPEANEGPPIAPSIGIEFDTFNNTERSGDIVSDHTALVYNGDFTAPKVPATRIDPERFEVEDGTCLNITVKWDPATQELSLYYNNVLRFRHQDDVVNTVFNGATAVHYGFTGSTGGQHNQQTVLFVNGVLEASNDRAETTTPTPVTIPALANDRYTNGEPFVLSQIINTPRHGSAVVSDGTIIYTPNADFTGVDSLRYEITNANEITCSPRDTATVLIAVTCPMLPPASNTASGPLDLCPGESVTIRAATASSYLWSTGATTQSITVSQAGEYWVTTKNQAGCEYTSLPTKVTVLPPAEVPTLTATGPTTFCGAGSVVLTVPTTAEGIYEWKRNGIAMAANGTRVTATEEGVYEAVLVTRCSRITSNSIRITIQPLPAAPAVVAGIRCGAGTVTLTASGEATGEYRWYNSPTSPEPLPNAKDSRFVTPFLETESTFYVAAVKNGCESTRVPVRATIINPVAADAGKDTLIDQGSSAQLRATGDGSYQWSPAASLSNPSIANPVARPAETTTYTLTVTSPQGCIVTDEVTVSVRKDIIIPNAFSPNGDGVNDTWEIVNVENFLNPKVEVYDRWGSKIYESVGYQNNWDGKVNGQEMPANTYFYVITLSTTNRRLTGSVSIIR